MQVYHFKLNACEKISPARSKTKEPARQVAVQIPLVLELHDLDDPAGRQFAISGVVGFADQPRTAPEGVVILERAVRFPQDQDPIDPGCENYNRR
jgi:hypothetical protein